jgi:hypothetical protein
MESIMAPRAMLVVALLLGTILLIVMAPASAHAAWKSADAHIVDPNGTGYVSLLNVSVANYAENDSAAVTEVQLSDEGTYWYPIPYTGLPQDWVLSGEAGAKTLYVRFAAADGTVSPVVEAHINVDTQGPRTRALKAVRGGQGTAARFRFSITDKSSPRVKATLVIRGAGVNKRVPLGWVRTGVRSAVARLTLPRGRYHWSVRAVDLASWAQEKQASQALFVH